MTDELITELGQVSALRVVSRTSVMTYKGSKKLLPEIARELGVDAVVEGSVLREGDQVRITAQLIDARTDQHIWSQSYVRDLDNVLALQGEVAQARICRSSQHRGHAGGAGPPESRAPGVQRSAGSVLAGRSYAECR